MRYINRCSDKTPPSEEEPMLMEHPIYFAGDVSTWEDKGVAFLDIDIKGVCFGKRYLITKEQFGEIRRMEGPNYTREVDMGAVDGIPVKTFTHLSRFSQDNKPGMRYIGVIKKGIQDTYTDMSESEIDAYLMDKYLHRKDKALLSFLRAQEHGVTVQAISGGLQISVPEVIDIIPDLVDRGFIRQDRVNARATAWNSVHAVYYTMRDLRAAIDICCR
jgi:hypothetical protein